MKLSKRIKSFLAAVLLVSTCAAGFTGSVFAGEYESNELRADYGWYPTGTIFGYVYHPEADRRNPENRARFARIDEANRALGRQQYVGEFIDDEGKTHDGSMQWWERLDVLRRKPDPCADLKELKHKLAEKQLELMSKMSPKGLEGASDIHKLKKLRVYLPDHETDARVFWVNKEFIRIRYEHSRATAKWCISKWHKWYGDDLWDSTITNGVDILLPLSFDYCGNNCDDTGSWDKDELRNCILDASNWIAVRGTWYNSDELHQESVDEIKSLDEYFAYLKEMGIIGTEE